jgi:hypothetical protein
MKGLCLGVLAIGLAYGLAFLPGQAAALAPWLMVAGIVALLLSLILLGVRRPGRSLARAVLMGMVFLLLAVGGGFAAALALPGEGAGSPLWLGLPRRVALLVYGIGLLPALVLPLCYALSFDSAVLNQADLDKLRRELAELNSRRDDRAT